MKSVKRKYANTVAKTAKSFSKCSHILTSKRKFLDFSKSCSLDCRDAHKCEEVKASKLSEEQADKKTAEITPGKRHPDDKSDDDDDPDAVRVPKRTLELMSSFHQPLLLI